MMDPGKLHFKVTSSSNLSQKGLQKYFKSQPKRSLVNIKEDSSGKVIQGTAVSKKKDCSKPQGNQIIPKKFLQKSILNVFEMKFPLSNSVCKENSKTLKKNKKLFKEESFSNECYTSSSLPKNDKRTLKESLIALGTIYENEESLSPIKSYATSTKYNNSTSKSCKDLSICRGPSQASYPFSKEKKLFGEDSDDNNDYDDFNQNSFPRKKPLSTSDDEALWLHFVISNKKCSKVQSLELKDSEFEEKENFKRELAFSEDMWLPELVKMPSIFSSQNSQSTRASSRGIYDTDLGENDDMLYFNTNPREPDMITSIFMNEEDPSLECPEPFNLDLIKTKAVNDQTCVNQFKLLSNNDSKELEDAIKNWENNLNKQDIEEKDKEFLQNLQTINFDYFPNANHLSENQPEISESIRATLIDWMIEVCSDYGLKRDTLYIAVNYLDKYLTIIPNVPKWKLQLIGTTCLFMASKVEEIYVPKVKEFAESTDDGYTKEDILKTELEICHTFKWKLNPTTLYTLANSYMTWWDKFVINSFPSLNIINEGNYLYFKQSTAEAYLNFREVTQILDLMILKTETLQYTPSILAASLIYLVIGKSMKIFSKEDIIKEFAGLEDFQRFNEVFELFLKEYNVFEFGKVLSMTEYVRQFFAVELCTEFSDTVKEKAKSSSNRHLEELLSFQTHSKANLPFIQGVIEDCSSK